MNKNKHLCNALVLLPALIGLLLPVVADAAPRFARTTNTWAATTWSATSCAAGTGAAVPANGDDVTICPGVTVTLTSNTNNLGSLTVDGTLTFGNNTTARTLTVGGNILVNSTGTINVANFTVTHSLVAGGNITNNGSFDLVFDANSLCNTTLNGAGPQVIGGTSAGTTEFNNVTVTNSLTINKSGAAVTQTGTLSVGGNLLVQAGTLSLGNTTTITGTTVISGTLLHANTTGTRTFTGTVTVNSGGTWTNSVNEGITFGANLVNDGTFTSGTGTHAFTAGTAQLSGAAAITFGGPVTASGNLTINKSAGDVTTSNTLTVTGGLTVQAGTLSVANTVAVTGATSISGTLTNTTTTGSRTFTGGVTVNSGGTFSNNTVAEPVTIGGDFINNGTFNSGTAAYTFSSAGQWGGSSGLNFGGAVNVTAGARANNTTVDVAGTLALSANVTLTNNATVNAAGAITGANATTSVWTNAANSTLNIGGALLATGTLNASASGNTVNYNGAAAQAAKNASGNQYFHLTFSGAGTNTMATAGSTFNILGNLAVNAGSTLSADSNDNIINVTGNMTVAGTYLASNTAGRTLTVAGNLNLTGTFTGNTAPVTLAGNFTSSGTFTSGAGLFTLNGGAAQLINGTNPPTFTNLTVNSAGVSLGGVDATVSSVLTLTSGVVTTGGNVLAVTGNCPGSVVRTAGHVAGLLRLRIPTGSPTCVFPVGDAAGYRPVTIAFTTVTNTGTRDVTASVTQAAGEHPNLGSSTIEPLLNVNRYWTLANNTTTFTSAIATFQYLAGDADAGGDQTSFIAGRYASGTWTYPSSSASAGSVQVSGLLTATLAGDYALGEVVPVLFSHWRMDQPGGWNGSSNEVIDSGSGGFHGVAAGLVTRPTTSAASPAIAGTPGTCQYGVFNRSNKDYVALGAGYPNLMSTAGGFTITAWINTTNSALPGQRIFIDDQNNATPGGWGFSVGETDRAGAGGLRFYYRQATTVTVDTVAIPSNQWLFVALTVNLAAGANASRATLYAYNTAGTLVTTYTQTFTWTAGTDAGPPSIGGETNAAGENTNAFGFSGSIDELRVYQQALSEGRLNLIRQETRDCNFLNHIRIEHDGVGLTCAPETVTVKACTDALCTSTYTGSVTTTLSPAGWVGGNTITFSGTTNVDLRRTVPGVVTLGAGTTTPTPASATRCFNGLLETCSLDFRNTGFLFGAIPAQTAGTTSATHTVQAVRTDNNTGVCTGVFTGNVPNIELASECVNPGTCQSGQQVTFNNNGSGTIAANNSASVGSWTARTLTFGVNSTASFTFAYPDVGAIRLHARYNINGSGDYMTGTSSNVVVKPAGFTVSNIRRASDNFANPGAANAGGAVFMRAGENIALTATAVNSLGAATPNFGKETPAEGVQLTTALAGGLGLTSNPGLGNSLIAGSAFTAGAAAVNNLTWGEVGIMTITPRLGDGNYLGAGDVVGTASGNVGRFTPHHFTVATNTPSFTAACSAGGFTYVGQAFSYGVTPVLTVTARNFAGGTTVNYKGTSPAGQAFFKLTNASLTGKSYAAATGTLDVSGITGTDPAIVDNGNGTATLTFASGTGLLFTRSAPAAPFDADISLAINVIDADSVAYASNPARFGQATAGNGMAFTGSKSMRFGRLRLGGASGSQLLALNVPFEAQYWTGAFFATNTADTCSTFVTGNVGLGNYIGNLGAGETTVAAITSPLQGGRGSIRLSAPGVGNNGSVDVAVNLGAGAAAGACAGFAPTATAGNKVYLRGGWCAPGTYIRDPAARARFGIQRSSDEAIYSRETTN